MNEFDMHKDHDIVTDAFAQLTGVRRLVAGDLYCLTCHTPVEAPADDPPRDQSARGGA